ncbi:MAG TPA: hypothetical protein ENJ23_04890 [Bacteroidetes bacterium]|nr:hypothetical protein [Bacteroidota bacterium]
MEYILGVDGGGTKSLAVLARETGEVVATFQKGPANFQQIGEAGLQSLAEEILQEAERSGGIRRDEIVLFVLGLAGVGRRDDHRRAEEALSRVNFSGRILLTTDAYIALMGAFESRPGIIVIAGTGSICFGLDEEGELYRSGGWGYLLGDEGSGYFIGHQAILAALKDFDGRGEKTILRPRIESHFDLTSIEDIVPRVYAKENSIGKEEIAGLAPLVFECAADGDDVAEQIVELAGKELARMVHAVGKRMKKLGEPLEVAYVGSVFKQKHVLLPVMKVFLSDHYSELDIHEPSFEPAPGAIILGLKELGKAITLEVLENLRTTYRAP